MDSSQGQIDDQESGVVTSSLFNAADADVVFRSCDGVLFHIHTKNLDITSDGFPPAEFAPDGQIVDLPENAKTLELMFQFVYPRLQPSLAHLAFDVLQPLAEVVEKYQIFTGKELCKIRMTQFLPSNAIAILDYSIRHDYPELANSAAPFVTLRDLSRNAAIAAVSPELLRAWVPYYEQWVTVISAITTSAFAVKNNHDGYGGCTGWPVYQKNILNSFAHSAGNINNGPPILSVIVVPHGAAHCCQNEAQNWRNEATRLISGIRPFIQKA